MTTFPINLFGLKSQGDTPSNNLDTVITPVRVGMYDVRNEPITINNTNATTGFDLTKNTENLKMGLLIRDDNNSRSWPWQYIDVKSMIDRFEADDAFSAFGFIFDNDHIRIKIIDPVEGILNFVDIGRSVEIAAIELIEFKEFKLRSA